MKKKNIFYFILIVFLLVFSEVLSFTLMSAYNLIIEGDTLKNTLQKRRDDFTGYSIDKKKELLEMYNPITQFSLPPKSINADLKTNKYGFVKNEEKQEDDSLNLFSEKPKNLVRIIMMGGSSTQGVGVKNNQTIAAHLEKILNTRKKK